MTKQMILLFLLGVAATFLACADVAPAYIPFEDLYGSADIVAAARCDSVRALTPQDAPLIDYEEAFSSLAVFKGNLSGTFTVSIPRRPIAHGVPACGQMQVLVFLKQMDASGTYPLSDQHYGMRRVPPTFAKSAQALTANGSSGLPALQDALVQVAATAPSGEGLEALRILRDFDVIGPDARRVLKAILQGSDPTQRLLALEMLARLDPSSYFGLFAETFKGQTGHDPMSSVRICEIAQRGTRADQLSQLEAMADWQDDPGLRECAMHGIRHLHIPASVPFLVHHLNDSQEGVAYQALITLSEISGLQNADYAPGKGPFSDDPQKYIKRWQDWWNAGGSAKYAGTR